MRMLVPAVRRHLQSAIAPGTPLATSARLRMRGQRKLGGWLPFRAEQVLAPHHGFIFRFQLTALEPDAPSPSSPTTRPGPAQ